MLVERINSGVSRKCEMLDVKKGRPITKRVKGHGRYRSFTARTMLKTTSLNKSIGVCGVWIISNLKAVIIIKYCYIEMFFVSPDLSTYNKVFKNKSSVTQLCKVGASGYSYGTGEKNCLSAFMHRIERIERHYMTFFCIN